MKKGFTLLEMIIVIIVIGLLATLAVPRYFKLTERARSVEGVSLLGLLRASQIRYKAEQGVYTTDATKLDLEYTSPKFFSVESPTIGTEVARVRRGDLQKSYGNYTLTINEEGYITCTGGDAGACAAIGR